MSNKKTIKTILYGLWLRLLHLFARHFFPSKLRIFLHRLRGVKVGKNVLIGVDVHIDEDRPDLVTIEDGVFLTAGCMLLTHQRDLKYYKYGKWIGDCPLNYGSIVIKKGVHIGIRTVIMPGVTIGEGAIIGASALVNKDIPPYSVAVGVPAKVIKTFKPEDKNENLD
jgi:acetyltransferase-like isoleucine patch superfamily enzyme